MSFHDLFTSLLKFIFLRSKTRWTLNSSQTEATMQKKLSGTFKLPASVLQDIKEEVKVLFAQLCPTLCGPVDCSPPGSSVHGILQARILEWVAIPFSRGSSQPRDQTWISRIEG